MGKHDGTSGSGRGQEAPAALGSARSVLEWEALSSVDDIEKMAQRKFPHLRSLDLSGMDRQTAMEAMQEYERFMKKYPDTAKYMQYIEKRTVEKAALMATVPGEGHCGLAYYAQNTQKGHVFINQRFAEHHKNGVLMERNFREAFQHEMFHVMHQHLSLSDQQRVNTFLAKHYKKSAGDFGTNATLVRTGLRPHAEFFAELGTAMSQGSRSPVVREYRGLLRTLQKEGKL